MGKQVKWELNLEKGSLKVKYEDDAKADLKASNLKTFQEFDLTKLFRQPWDTFDAVEKETIAYGVKQKLSDRTQSASGVKFTPTERFEWQKLQFNTTMCKERKFSDGNRGGAGGGIAKSIAWEAAFTGFYNVFVKSLGMPEEEAKVKATAEADASVERMEAAKAKAKEKAKK
jgi:hypothetical protein